MQLTMEFKREFHFKTAQESFEDFNTTFVNNEG